MVGRWDAGWCLSGSGQQPAACVPKVGVGEDGGLVGVAFPEGLFAVRGEPDDQVREATEARAGVSDNLGEGGLLDLGVIVGGAGGLGYARRAFAA